MRGLVSCLWKERQATAEEDVASSAVHSPCCGPIDIEALTRLEAADDAIRDIQQGRKPWEEVLDSLIVMDDDDDDEHILELRFLYVPTAMYAIRSDSTNTPGKQRQRARADGKQRRNEIANLLSDRLGDRVPILTITLDLDDASVKQPEGSEDPSRFPTVSRNHSSTNDYNLLPN
jgi:hypothetical protein